MQTKNEREIAMSDKKFADFQLQPYLLTAIQKLIFVNQHRSNNK